VLLPLILLEVTKDRKYAYITGLLLFFSGLAFVNILFVWPKLYSALYQAIAFYMAYKIWVSKKKETKYYIYYGVAASLGLLAHGGSVFYLVPLSVLVLYKSKGYLLDLSKGLLASIVVYAPWIYYQKVIDPPGDRLLKQHLANGIGMGDREIGALESIKQYYSSVTLDEWLYVKTVSLKNIFTNLYFHIDEILSYTNRDWLVPTFRYIDFSYLFFSSLLVVFIFFIKDQKEDERSFLRLMIASFIGYIAFWVIILTNYITLHIGAYFGVMSGFIAITLIVYRFNRVLFYILAFLNLLIFFKEFIVGYVSFSKDYIITSSLAVIFFIVAINGLFKLLKIFERIK
jgi:hypothetical protein